MDEVDHAWLVDWKLRRQFLAQEGPEPLLKMD
jgi:hypothetical protein